MYNGVDSRSLFRGELRPVANVFDISIREPGTTAVFGQTARGMYRTYELVRQMGFARTQIASFCFGERYTVQDQFVELLRRKGDDLGGCFASLTCNAPEAALDKIVRYSIQNAFVDFFIGGADGGVDHTRAHELARSLVSIIERLRAILPAPGLNARGLPVGEIYINFGDFVEQRQARKSVFVPLFARLKALSFQGVCFEEFRGAALPEDIFEAAQFLRSVFPHETHTILGHIHGGNGLDDACNLAAVAGGADGVWAAMMPTSALAGHGSSLVYLTNLYRYGNAAVTAQFGLGRAHAACTELHRINHAESEAMPIELPVFGRNAYAVNFAAFSQNAALPGMLPSHVVGRSETARFVPLLCDPVSIRRRFGELGIDDVSDEVLAGLLDQVHRRLLDDLGAQVDTRIDFNDPGFLRAAYIQARAACVVEGEAT